LKPTSTTSTTAYIFQHFPASPRTKMGVSCSPPKELAGVHSLVGARGSFFKETLAKILFCRAKFNAPEQFHGQIGCFERGIQSHRGQTRGLERFRDGTRNFGGGASSPGAWKTSPNGKIEPQKQKCLQSNWMRLQFSRK